MSRVWGSGDTKQLLLIPTLIITSGQPPASREVNDIGVEEREFSTVLIWMCCVDIITNATNLERPWQLTLIQSSKFSAIKSVSPLRQLCLCWTPCVRTGLFICMQGRSARWSHSNAKSKRYFYAPTKQSQFAHIAGIICTFKWAWIWTLVQCSQTSQALSWQIEH